MPGPGNLSNSAAVAPQVTWAQRKERILLSIVLSDIKDPKIEISSEKVHFSGKAGPDQKSYAVDIELFDEIDPENSKYVVHDRLIDFNLEKKNKDAKFWPRLLKSTGKAGWLKTDFSRWKDEDEEDEPAPSAGAGGFGDFGGGGGMGGMGGFGGGGDLESMMQQMGGMGGMGGGGDESDDDDYPGKEGDEERKGAAGDGEESDDEMPKLE